MANTKTVTATTTGAATASKSISAAVTTNAHNRNFSMQLNASELTAIIMKGSPNSNDRDAGFCSGSSEGGDDICMDHGRLGPSSPTSPDASEDSVEVKVKPIALIRNKRKSSEPAKLISERDADLASCVTAGTTLSSAPFKKRIRYTSTTDSAVVLTSPAAATPPPQLWDPSQVLPHDNIPPPAQIFVRHPAVTTLHRLPAAAVEEQLEPLALISRKPAPATEPDEATQFYVSKKLKQRNEVQHRSHNKKSAYSTETSGGDSPELIPLALITNKPSTSRPAMALAPPATQMTSTILPPGSVELIAPVPTSIAACISATASIDGDSKQSGSSSVHGGGGGASSSARPQQRNYKNMTRERRIEANARERTRVHTISAAYETLRRAVPSYSNAQKLSKLSVLRIACSYILTLSRMAGHDYSIDQSEPSVADCFEAVTETIQTEGKIRKKRDE